MRSGSSFSSPRTGLQNWQLLVIALISTLFFLSVFIGCIYYVILTIIRRLRKTRPSGDPVPTESFVDKGASEKRRSLAGEGVLGVKQAKKHSFKRKSQRLERTRAQLRREMNVLRDKEEEEGEEGRRGASVVVEERKRVTSTVVEEGRRGTSTVVEEERRRATSMVVEERKRGTSMLVETDDDEVPSTSIRPLTKFILPLHYSNGHGYEDGAGGQRHNLRRTGSFGSWSLSSWEMEPLEAGLDWWPARRQFRRPAHQGESTKTIRPLLLDSAASDSEEDE
ncbi:hypothetical protein O3P69_010157 [Scylla paramamosain]|uniref:Uncharacterized protein n=1 Tax=Scylla paramamosain TaxID=85552 RepID=A0AAW0TR69_SCYPA